MRHAILGAGGIGGLIGAALARAGADVVLLMRPESITRYDGRLNVESPMLGDFNVEIRAATKLDRDIDALWVAVKATQLEAALPLVPANRVAGATVVPFLNGIDHMDVLRAHYANVVAGAIRVESERITPSRIRQITQFLRVDLAGAEPLAAELRDAGIPTRVSDDERAVLWEKLVFLAPVALGTTAFDAPYGGVRHDERYRSCQEEVLAVAHAEGAAIDVDALQALVAGAPDTLQSSMHKDVAAGRPPELDAIAGPILRGGEKHGISVAATSELVRMVGARLRQPMQ